MNCYVFFCSVFICVGLFYALRVVVFFVIDVLFFVMCDLCFFPLKK